MCLYLGRHKDRERDRPALRTVASSALSLSLPLQPFGQQLLLAAENDLSKGILMTLRATTAAYLPAFYGATACLIFSACAENGVDEDDGAWR